LLDTLLPFAQRLLLHYVTFQPFGAGMAPDGEITALVIQQDDSDLIQNDPMFEKIIEHMQEKIAREAWIAAGICRAVSLIPPGQPDKAQAVQVSLEHESGAAIEAYLPYRRESGGEIAFGVLITARGEGRLFGSRSVS
jgi:hypothetical protein